MRIGITNDAHNFNGGLVRKNSDLVAFVER